MKITACICCGFNREEISYSKTNGILFNIPINITPITVIGFITPQLSEPTHFTVYFPQNSSGIAANVSSFVFFS